MDQWAALAELLRRERETLLLEWRQKVRELPSAQSLTLPALNDHVPKLIDELIHALRHPERDTPAQPPADAISIEHGIQRAQHGYDIGEVVAEYGMLRGCIHTLVEIHGLPLRDGQLHVLNGMLDRAIGVSVQAFAVQCELADKKRRDEHLSFVAHDLRTPLNAVALATRLLEHNGQRDEDRRRVIEVLKRNVRQLASLVDSVLHANSEALAEGDGQPQRRLLQLWPLVEELVIELRPEAERGATRLTHRVPDDLMVCADANILRRVLQNLLGGAIAHMPGAQVEIDVRTAADAADAAVVACSVRGGRAPIAPERLQALLDPPAGVRGGGPGFFAIAKTLVEAHGSTLRIEEGTDGLTFGFTLPTRNDPAPY